MTIQQAIFASFGPGILNVSVGSTITATDMRTLANNAGYTGSGYATIIITIESGISIYSTSTGTAALLTGTFPAEVTLLKLVNNGFVTGMGGNGGAGGSGHGQAGFVGVQGGTAFSASQAVTVDNPGTLRAGGSGGGGGGGGSTDGKGCSSGAGGAGGNGQKHTTIAQSGSSANPGGNGGAGSDWGTTGTAGSAGNTGCNGGQSGGSGGSQGLYATGNSNITWETTGTRQGGVS